MAELRLLDPSQYPCGCCGQHVPISKVNHGHHIIPLAWGGPDSPDNRVALCPTGHDNVHWLHRLWTKAGGRQPRGVFNRYLYDIAAQGWDTRPSP